MSSEKTAVEMTKAKQHHGGRFYTIFVDDVEYQSDHSPVTGGEIMDLAGIPYDVGLIQVFEDGTQAQVGVDEEIDLKPGRRFKKAPRFKRGSNDRET
jgi:hypothetical protein